MLPSRAISGFNLPSEASALSRRLLAGPTSQRGEVEDWMRDQRNERHWCGIANLIADGALEMDAHEAFDFPQMKERLGLLRIAMEWLDTDQPRSGIQPRPNHVHEGPELVVLALIERGLSPIDAEEEEILLEMALRGGSLKVFQALYAQAQPYSKVAIGEWLNQGRAFAHGQWSGNGAQLLARRGQVELLGHLIDAGLVGVNQQDSHQRTLAHHAQHASMVEMLARKGFDPTLADDKGHQAPQVWHVSVPRAQNQIAMRNTWFRHFSDQTGIVPHERIAHESLHANLLVATHALVDLDRKLAGRGTGFVDGRTLPGLAARLSRIAWSREQQNRFFKGGMGGAEEAWKHVDPTRMLPCGVSEGFHFAMGHFSHHSEWATRQTSAYERSPEFNAPLHEQREAVARLVQEWKYEKWQGEEPFYEMLLRHWWQMHAKHHYQTHTDPRTLLFLGEPDPNHPQGLSMVEQHSFSLALKEQLNSHFQSRNINLAQFIATHTQQPQAWMDAVLRLCLHDGGMAPGPQETYFLTNSEDTGWRHVSCTSLLVALMDRGTLPSPEAMQRMPKGLGEQIRERNPQFHALYFQGWELNATTPLAASTPAHRRL